MQRNFSEVIKNEHCYNIKYQNLISKLLMAAYISYYFVMKVVLLV